MWPVSVSTTAMDVTATGAHVCGYACNCALWRQSTVIVDNVIAFGERRMSWSMRRRLIELEAARIRIASEIANRDWIADMIGEPETPHRRRPVEPRALAPRSAPRSRPRGSRLGLRNFARR